MRILFCGDSPTASTGFGVVSKNLLKQLYSKGHKIVCMAINWYGEPYDREQFPYEMFPSDRGPIEMVYGYGKFWHIVEGVKPDLIFFLNDPWIIEKYLEYKPAGFDDSYIKYMAYYPIDAGPLKPQWAKMLTEKMDAQICYSHFGEKVITEANGFIPENLHQIYHGVDTKVFYPIDQQHCRQRLGLQPDWFIVGMVARNQYRKRFDLLMKAFGEFAQGKDNVKLYLHTVLADVGYDILDLARQFDIEDKLILTEQLALPVGVPDGMLNYIYNSFDVNALISLGDGFGLPVAESMATGCPQLVSDHSCLRELVEGHGGLTVKNDSWVMNVSGINTWGGVSSVSDIKAKLNLFYESRDLRIKMAEDAYHFITQEKFTWPVIGNQFDAIIDKIFHLVKGGGDSIGIAA